MARVIVLDTSPLWLAASAVGKPPADACRAWIKAIEIAGYQIVLPEICDYEVRREFLLRGAIAGIRRLDSLKATIDYQPINTLTMLKAAEFWAHLRQGGLPTAGSRELDADAILAAQTILAGQPGDTVTIATTNVGHLSRFPGVDAQLWSAIS